MSARHEIRDGTADGYATAVLTSSAAGGLSAAFVPEAGMVGCSLTHRGDELLGQRKGLRRYASEGGTMGIPLLHPFANRLATDQLEAGGRRIDLRRAAPRLKRDPNGLAIHGLLAGASGWSVEPRAEAERAAMTARFDF